ncbi:tyrosine-type recombinase/integrase [Solwaraspora sp. WMMD792]|uniref:tyrosine-type recombinase/integrase n=1 Tax=Solwaraspora sp. WMMD792 TaxID=3016099 RepID=UPI0024165F2C|nr:tyrosine-type recombinase/integrase [Solwaraspora sp. WMMD792]MDG4773498.1 tyrosine-type recombinase/integrase [Solwaraspora sp. WMMD792]
MRSLVATAAACSWPWRSSTNPRDPLGRRYPLISVPAAAVCAVMAGAYTFAAVCDWVRLQARPVRARLGFTARMPCGIPSGQTGRPSKSLTLDQAKAILKAAEHSRLYAYVVVSLLTGARTEELRALRWDRVDLVGRPDADPPVPPTINVWRSVRAGGDTKTRKSRRTLALPARCVAALNRHQADQERARQRAGSRWTDTGVVFSSSTGQELDAANVRRAFRRIARLAGLNDKEWTPREMRHSFVSLLSDSGMSLEQIADLVGHSGTSVTEKVYRHQLRPVLLTGARAMDEIFGPDDEPAGKA